MDAEKFEILSKKLDAIIALLALDKFANKSKTEAILMLNQFGLDNQTIASVVGTSAGTVAVRLSEAKKSKGDKNAKKDKASEESESDDVSRTEEI